MTTTQSFHQEYVTAGRDCAVLRIVGEIDVYTAPRIREQMVQFVADGIQHVVADLRGVDFLDSTGLGAFVGGLKRLRREGGSLALVTRPGRVLQVFEVTGLIRVFAMYPSVQEAIAGDENWQAGLAAEGHAAGDWCRHHEL